MSKLSISNAWDETRAIVGRNFGLLATVALALLVLPGVVSDLFMPPTTPGELPEPGPWLALFVVAFIIGLIGQLAIIRLAIADRSSVGEAIGHGLNRVVAYFVAILLWTLPFALVVALVAQTGDKAALGLALLILLPLFIFLFVRMMMSSPVASAEAGGPLHILQRSWALTRGNWWKLFGFFLLLIVAGVVVIVALSAIIALLVRMLFGEIEPMSVGALVTSLLTQVLGAAITVVFVTMLARIYVQLSGRVAEPSVPSSEA